MNDKNSKNEEHLFRDVVKPTAVEPEKPAFNTTATASKKPLIGIRGEWIVCALSSPTNLKILEMTLLKRRIGAHCFRTGGEALDFLKSSPEEVFRNVIAIITDFDLAKSNGIKFLQEVKTAEKLSHLPLVFAAEPTELPTIEKIPKHLFETTLQKPIVADKINEAVNSILSKGKARLSDSTERK